MDESLENFVEFKVKDFRKINKKIICLTYLKETLKTNDTIFNNFIETYKNLLNEHKGCFVFIDSRNIRNINYQSIITRMKEISKLDKLVSTNVIGVVYFMNSPVIKGMGNSIMKIYKPVVPTKFCDNNQEGFNFLMDVYSKKDKKE